MDMRVSDVATNSSGTPFTIPRTDWLLVPASTPLADLRRLVSEFHKGSNSVSVIGLMKDMTNPDSCMGVVEFEDLLGD